MNVVWVIDFEDIEGLIVVDWGVLLWVVLMVGV